MPYVLIVVFGVASLSLGNPLQAAIAALMCLLTFYCSLVCLLGVPAPRRVTLLTFH